MVSVCLSSGEIAARYIFTAFVCLSAHLTSVAACALTKKGGDDKMTMERILSIYEVPRAVIFAEVPH